MPPGKNFSCNNLGQRRKADLYETPYSITEQFIGLDLLPPDRSTLEPAAGSGAIVRVLKQQGFTDVQSYDIETDFLTERRRFSQIITNPPYSSAHAFIQHGKVVAEDQFAFLLPLAYLHGKRRYDDIFSDRRFPLASVHVFTRYPMLGDALRDDGKYRTGMMVYAWFVWHRLHTGPPCIGWLDNHSSVLGARIISPG